MHCRGHVECRLAINSVPSMTIPRTAPPAECCESCSSRFGATYRCWMKTACRDHKAPAPGGGRPRHSTFTDLFGLKSAAQAAEQLGVPNGSFRGVAWCGRPPLQNSSTGRPGSAATTQGPLQRTFAIQALLASDRAQPDRKIGEAKASGLIPEHSPRADLTCRSMVTRGLVIGRHGVSCQCWPCAASTWGSPG